MNLQKGNRNKYVLFTFLGLLAAVGSMGVIYMINAIINNYFSGTKVPSGRYFTYFFAALSLFLISRWVVSMSIIAFTQKLLLKTRAHVLHMVLRSSFLDVSRNRARIFTAMTRDTDSIVTASINIMDVLTNGCIILICFIYMGILAWQLLLCMLALLLVTLVIYFYYVGKARKLFIKAMDSQDRFVKYLNEILSGFKEITMERRKGFSIAEKHIHPAITNASVLNRKAHVTFLNNRIIGIMSFYVFIGILLLFLGELFHIQAKVVVNFIFLILYVFGPIETLVLMIPSLTQANESLKRVNRIEAEMVVDEHVSTAYVAPPVFTGLQLKNIVYQYQGEGNNDEQAFGIGPLDFQLMKGEIIFISGGNGSGKTTFLNILIGLFEYDEGALYLNGTPVKGRRTAQYHALFAPVFNDFHLFDELYGIASFDAEKVREYITLFELEEKVYVQDGKFSTINLSAGQRKRLALIGALLEGKPILVLDEFAADQDPRFKYKFYTEIIPYIRQQGFSIVAITHDDAYYSVADQLLKMEGGCLYKLRTGVNNPAPIIERG